MIEMIVAVAVSLVAMAIAAELILEAQRRIAQSGRRNLDMSTDLAFDFLRLDVRGSQGFVIPFGMSGTWNDAVSEPLELQGHYSGKVIVYELVDRNLRRVVYPPKSFDPESQRIVLQEVSLFRWRNHPDALGVLELLVMHEETAPLTGRVAGGQREVLEPALRETSLLLYPRDVLPFLGKIRW